MLKIWRIENNDGEGCYRLWQTNSFVRYMERRHNNSMEKHPFPKLDNGIDREIKNGEICGFRDLSQVKNWFSRYELKNLAKIGFTLKKVEVREITAFGEKQVLAIR